MLYSNNLKLKCSLYFCCSSLILQNIEAEKQLKFFQGCVASAFAERDNAVMEVINLVPSQPFLGSLPWHLKNIKIKIKGQNKGKYNGYVAILLPCARLEN